MDPHKDEGDRYGDVGNNKKDGTGTKGTEHCFRKGKKDLTQSPSLPERRYDQGREKSTGRTCEERNAVVLATDKTRFFGVSRLKQSWSAKGISIRLEKAWSPINEASLRALPAIPRRRFWKKRK